MATDLRTLPAYFSNDAEFRAWGSGISAQLAAVGLVQAADTGQINWATVVRPGGSNASAGYEIWRFNDALQATKPVFIKMEWGVGTSNFIPWIRCSVGTGTNGAGTLTGQLSSVASGPFVGLTPGATRPSYCSGSSSRLNLVTNLDSSAASAFWLFFVERTKTSAMADTGDGYITLTLNSANAISNFQVIPFIGTFPAAGFNNPSMDFNQGGFWTSGSDIALAPTLVALGKILYASWCGYRHADMSELIAISLNHFGGVHTYMPLGDGATWSNKTNISTTIGLVLAMLWE